MRITVILGSPRASSRSSFIAEHFIRGTESAGHEVTVFDLRKLSVHPCWGCDYCKEHGGACCREDDFREIGRSILAADAVVFATPVYFFDVSAQLKAVIDRMHSIIAELRSGGRKKVVLITTCGKADESTVRIVNEHIGVIAEMFHWDKPICINALGVRTMEDAVNGPCPEQAEKTGRTL